MVVFLDLGAESNPRHDVDFKHEHPVRCEERWHIKQTTASEKLDPTTNLEREERTRANKSNSNGFSATLSCYPIASQLASLLDLNDLDALSLTCRQFRVNLLEYREELVKLTLRCSNETEAMGLRLAERMLASHVAWNERASGASLLAGGRILSGRVGRCARDMNCVIKPPPSTAFGGRHRRMCKACQKAPMKLLTVLPGHHNHDEESHMRRSVDNGKARTAPISAIDRDAAKRDLVETHAGHDGPDGTDHGFAASAAFQRGPCSCLQGLYLCHPCGRSLRASDDTYMHGWKWRTHYSAKLGGLGVGIGEGNEGVKCGRGRECLAVREVETEVECSADELRELQDELERVASESTTPNASSRSWEGTSYFSQEIEGVGGGMKRKVKKMIKVGAVVKEYEDERQKAAFLERERSGQVRSWCAWCERVVASTKDKQGGEAELNERTGHRSSLSSEGSDNGH